MTRYLLSFSLLLLLLTIQQVYTERNITELNIQEIGSSFWPPSVNLLEELTGGSTVYSDESITACLLQQDISESPSSFLFYENNNAIYNSIGGHLGLNINLAVASIAATLASVSYITFQSTTVQGTRLDYGQFVRSYDLSLSCLVRQDFDDEFLDALQALPSTINDTQSLSSYDAYRQFATIYGGFVVTRIILGARAQFFAMAESSRRYTEIQFSNRICAEISVLEGVNIGPCIGFNVARLRESLTLQMSFSKYIRGGNRALQAKLSTEALNSTTLESFIASASANPYPVGYDLEPVWELYEGSNTQIRNRLNHLRDYFILLSADSMQQQPDAATVGYSMSLVVLLLMAVITVLIFY